MTSSEIVQGVIGVTIGGTFVSAFWGSLALVLLYAIFGIVIIPTAVVFKIVAVLLTLIVFLMLVKDR